MTKINVFQNKLPKVCFISPLYCGGNTDDYQVPLEWYFPEYTGGFDTNKAAKSIFWKFMQANRAQLSVYPQYVAHLSSFYLVR